MDVIKRSGNIDLCWLILLLFSWKSFNEFGGVMDEISFCQGRLRPFFQTYQGRLIIVLDILYSLIKAQPNVLNVSPTLPCILLLHRGGRGSRSSVPRDSQSSKPFQSNAYLHNLTGCIWKLPYSSQSGFTTRRN